MTAPSVSYVKPARTHLVAGGTVVNIDGQHFTGTTGVTVGGTAATNVVILDDSHVQFTTPAKAVGSYHIVATNGTGASSSTSADLIEYYTSVVNNYGSTAVWLVKDEYGDIQSAETSLNNAKAKALVLGTLAVDIVQTTGTVVNSKVTQYNLPY